ncbi:hypothetical protein DH2020_011051 [Rehmannia glutinosa]|uniref:Transposase MuDR plant domain-containing protein n=1 Tax=Rehmannia glutinosa TaxID=99300 RepID=A0ABR0XC84_REHGL
MGWMIRDTNPNYPRGKICPDYGPHSELFTIRMHHSGGFLRLGSTYYAGENMKVSHIDFCDPDEMSMLEIISMGNELGLNGVKCFYYSKSGVSDCNALSLLQNDSDALNLVNSVDGNRIVGIFVEHDFPIVDEPLQFMGDCNIELDEVIEEQMGVDDDVEVSEEHVDQNETDDEVSDEHVNEEEHINDYDLSDSDYEQSVGSDSQRSEGFVDSEIEVSDDDLLFDGNIDDEVEWGGLSMNKNEAEASNSQLRSQLRTNEGSKLQKSHPVFNHKANISDPKFELGMQFPDIATFRSAVRQHTIKQGRDVKFTINLSYKVQAKCKHGKCPWVIYASKLPKEDTVQVKTYNGKHKCPRTQRVSHATTNYSKIQNKTLNCDTKKNPNYSSLVELNEKFVLYQSYMNENKSYNLNIA